MNTKYVMFAAVLVLLLFLVAGCSGDEAGAEIIDEEKRENILNHANRKGIAEEDIDWRLTKRIVDFEEVVWGYVPIGEKEVNVFIAYQKDLEADDFRRFVPEMEDIIQDAYPEHEVRIGGTEAR